MSLLDNLDIAPFSSSTSHPTSDAAGTAPRCWPTSRRRAAERAAPLLRPAVTWTDEHGVRRRPAGRDASSRWPAATGSTLGDVQRGLDAARSTRPCSTSSRPRRPQRHDGYTLRSWVGPVPDELALGWETLASSLMTEAPMGECEREPEDVDVASLREREARRGQAGPHGVLHGRARRRRRGGRPTSMLVVADARSRAGLPVGHPRRTATTAATGSAWRSRSPTSGCCSASGPTPTRVVTWNAEVNGHMIGVNERWASARVRAMGEFQKRLA